MLPAPERYRYLGDPHSPNRLSALMHGRFAALVRIVYMVGGVVLSGRETASSSH